MTRCVSCVFFNTQFLDNNLLPFHTLVQDRIGLIMYKCNSELFPNVLKEMFVANNSIHIHNTRQRHCIYGWNWKIYYKSTKYI